MKKYCRRGHERTPENTYVRLDNGYPLCRVCARERERTAKLAQGFKPKPLGAQPGHRVSLETRQRISAAKRGKRTSRGNQRLTAEQMTMIFSAFARRDMGRRISERFGITLRHVYNLKAKWRANAV